MHLLSAHHRSEFLAVPELVRFTMAHGVQGPEPTLLIKASTLTLKFLTRLQRFDLAVFGLANGWLGYGVQVHDDPDSPALLWSIVERTDEVEAFKALIERPKCMVFLFNELAVNVAWAELDIAIHDPTQGSLLVSSALHPTTDTSAVADFKQRVEGIQSGRLDGSSFLLRLPEVAGWQEVKSFYTTNRIGKSFLSIFEEDEGAQQEEVGLWLIDSLRPDGAVKSPQVHQQTKSRELADLLLSHDDGAFLFESKALAILSRTSLPSRAKLTDDLRKHLTKATKQLAGGLRNLRFGHRVTDREGKDVEAERNAPAHTIILVPDLALLSRATEFGGEFLKEFCARTSSFLHILDPAELLRMVQAAEMIAARGKATTPLMAFDFHLMNRFEHAVDLPTPNFDFLIRFA